MRYDRTIYHTPSSCRYDLGRTLEYNFMDLIHSQVMNEGLPLEYKETGLYRLPKLGQSL